MFIFTAYPGTIDENRENCLGLGGDLLQHNIGPDGSAYHRLIVVNIYLVFTRAQLYLFT